MAGTLLIVAGTLRQLPINAGDRCRVVMYSDALRIEVIRAPGRAVQGFNLGLAISKHCVIQNGG